jgi:hypothetical protein
MTRTLPLWNLPDIFTGMFVESYEGGYLTTSYSAVDAAEIERVLREHGVSYQTKIVRSRKRGVYYLIRVLDDAHEIA